MRTSLGLLNVFVALVGCSKPDASSGAAASSAAFSASAAPSPNAVLSGAAGAEDGKFAHPCAILTRADAEGILGATQLEEHEEPGGAHDADCVWKLPHGAGFAELRIHLPPHSKERFDRYADFTKEVPIEGVGDHAYVPAKGGWGHIDVMKGPQTFVVQIEHGNIATGPTSGSATTQQEAIALAKTIASRI